MHLVLSVPSDDARGRGELWLGGIAASGQVSVLRENGIGAILAASLKPPVAFDNTVQYLGCFDGTGVSTGTVSMTDLLRVFKEIVVLLKRGCKVLISCKNGAHRSSLLTALLLIFSTGCSASRARDYLVQLRNIVDLDSMPPPPKHPRQVQGPIPMQFLTAVQQAVAHEGATDGRWPFELNDILAPSHYKQLAMQLSQRDSQDCYVMCKQATRVRVVIKRIEYSNVILSNDLAMMLITDILCL